MKKILTLVLLVASATITNAQFGKKTDKKPDSTSTIADTTTVEKPKDVKPKGAKRNHTACNCEPPRTIQVCEKPMSTGVCDLKHLMAKMTSTKSVDSLYCQRFIKFINVRFKFTFTTAGDVVDFLKGKEIDYVWMPIPEKTYAISFLDCKDSTGWKMLLDKDPGSYKPKKYAFFTYNGEPFARGGVSDNDEACGNFVIPAGSVFTGNNGGGSVANSNVNLYNPNLNLNLKPGPTQSGIGLLPLNFIGDWGNAISRFMFDKNSADLTGWQSGAWAGILFVLVMVLIVSLCVMVPKFRTS